MDVGSIKSAVNPAVARDGVTESRQKQNLPQAVPTGTSEEQPSTGGSVPVKEASREQVEEAVATIQEFVQSVRRSINFAVEDGSGRVVVKVTDAGSGDVIRQIPSEEALKLAENLSEVRSLLFKAEA